MADSIYVKVGNTVEPLDLGTDKAPEYVERIEALEQSVAGNLTIQAARDAAQDEAIVAATQAANNAAPEAGEGISVSGKIVSLATVVTAGNAGPTANASPGYSGGFTVPYFSFDKHGRITGAANRTITLPAAPSVTNISGNAGTATKLQTARTISVKTTKYSSTSVSIKEVTGSVSFNGAGNVTITLPNFATGNSNCSNCNCNCSGDCS